MIDQDFAAKPCLDRQEVWKEHAPEQYCAECADSGYEIEDDLGCLPRMTDRACKECPVCEVCGDKLVWFGLPPMIEQISGVTYCRPCYDEEVCA